MSDEFDVYLEVLEDIRSNARKSAGVGDWIKERAARVVSGDTGLGESALWGGGIGALGGGAVGAAQRWLRGGSRDQILNDALFGASSGGVMGAGVGMLPHLLKNFEAASASREAAITENKKREVDTLSGLIAGATSPVSASNFSPDPAKNEYRPLATAANGAEAGAALASSIGAGMAIKDTFAAKKNEGDRAAALPALSDAINKARQAYVDVNSDFNMVNKALGDRGLHIPKREKYVPVPSGKLLPDIASRIGVAIDRIAAATPAQFIGKDPTTTQSIPVYGGISTPTSRLAADLHRSQRLLAAESGADLPRTIDGVSDTPAPPAGPAAEYLNKAIIDKVNADSANRADRHGRQLADLAARQQRIQRRVQTSNPHEAAATTATAQLQRHMSDLQRLRAQDASIKAQAAAANTPVPAIPVSVDGVSYPTVGTAVKALSAQTAAVQQHADAAQAQASAWQPTALDEITGVRLRRIQGLVSKLQASRKAGRTLTDREKSLLAAGERFVANTAPSKLNQHSVAMQAARRGITKFTPNWRARAGLLSLIPLLTSAASTYGDSVNNRQYGPVLDEE